MVSHRCHLTISTFQPPERRACTPAGDQKKTLPFAFPQFSIDDCMQIPNRIFHFTKLLQRPLLVCFDTKFANYPMCSPMPSPVGFATTCQFNFFLSQSLLPKLSLFKPKDSWRGCTGHFTTITPEKARDKDQNPDKNILPGPFPRVRLKTFVKTSRGQ